MPEDQYLHLEVDPPPFAGRIHRKGHGTRQEVTLYPPPVGRQTAVKTLPFRNFVCGR